MGERSDDNQQAHSGGAAGAITMNNWTNIHQELPDYNQPVLLTIKYGNEYKIMAGVLFRTDVKGHLFMVLNTDTCEIGTIRGAIRWDDSQYVKVTHWIPANGLPEVE